MTNRMKKIWNIITCLLITSAVLIGTFFGAMALYQFGFRMGMPTRSAQKTGVRQNLCFHDWSDGSGICGKCGLKCDHPALGKNNVCPVCGHVHRHIFENGVCTECGAVCSHPEWKDGVCTACGTACTHPEWDGNVCSVCGLYCPHTEFVDGVCTKCGMPCPHSDWKDGICTSCGAVCRHEEHSRETGICRVCGEKVYHDYSEGVCSCGQTIPFLRDGLSDSLLAGSEKKGRIVTVTYQTRKYAQDGREITKKMDVYLPYGYSTEEKYNVLLVLHDAGGNYTSWSTEAVTVGTSMTSPRNLYDSMIEQMLCRPLIIASVTTNCDSEDGPTDSGTLQMTPEIRNDILPCLAEQFSTWADNPSVQAVSDSRDHFAILGFGEGAVYALQSGMAENADLFSGFFLFGGESDTGGIADSEIFQTYPIRTLLCAASASDAHRVCAHNLYRTLIDAGEGILPGINAWYLETVQKPGIETDFILLYNALLAAFPG